MKFALTACVALTSVCYVLMSFANSIWELFVYSAIQGIGWAGATTLPTTIMVSNWFGPKVKGTAMSIAMLGSGAGALVWIKVVWSARPECRNNRKAGTHHGAPAGASSARAWSP